MPETKPPKRGKKAAGKRGLQSQDVATGASTARKRPARSPAEKSTVSAVSTPAGGGRPARRPRARPAAKPRGVVHGPGLQLNVGQHLLYIGQADIRLLPWEPGEVLNHVQIALRELGRGKVEMPPQVSLYPQREALLTAAPALVPNVRACGIKWSGSFPNNHRFQLPQVSALAVLSDPHTGFPIAVMDATWLTARRAPAVSAASAKLLARPESTDLAIIGGGVQGRGHIPALVDVLPNLQHIRVFDIRHSQAVKASKGWRGRLAHRVKIEPVRSVEQAVRDADVIVSATAISDKPQPSVRADMIRGGALLLPLDLDAVFEPAVFERADRFYVDSLENLDRLRDKGLFRKGLPANITGQLGGLFAGRTPGRAADGERIVCLNVGLGCVDVVLAHASYEKACRLGVGQVLEL